jgi:hypothetical protein
VPKLLAVEEEQVHGQAKLGKVFRFHIDLKCSEEWKRVRWILNVIGLLWLRLGE